MIGTEQIHEALVLLDEVEAEETLNMLGINEDALLDVAKRFDAVGIGTRASSFCAGFTVGVLVEMKRQEEQDDLEYGIDGES